VNWDLVDLVPPEADELDEILDVFGDNANLGLLQYEDRPSFASYLELQASRYRSQEDEWAVYLAGLIQAAADNARRHQATTPAELEARQELEDDERDANLVARGYDQCLAELQGDPLARYHRQRREDLAEGRRETARREERLRQIMSGFGE
jgi:hypothetical protein